MRDRRTTNRWRWPPGTERCRSKRSANDGSVADRQCPDSEVRRILRSHVSNFGIERTLANLLIKCGFGSEVRITNPRAAMTRTSEPPHWQLVPCHHLVGNTERRCRLFLTTVAKYRRREEAESVAGSPRDRSGSREASAAAPAGDPWQTCRSPRSRWRR
jgi:hypothetical protein